MLNSLMVPRHQCPRRTHTWWSPMWLAECLQAVGRHSVNHIALHHGRSVPIERKTVEPSSRRQALRRFPGASHRACVSYLGHCAQQQNVVNRMFADLVLRQPITDNRSPTTPCQSRHVRIQRVPMCVREKPPVCVLRTCRIAHR